MIYNAVMWDVVHDLKVIGYMELTPDGFDATTPEGKTATLDTMNNAADWLLEQAEGAGNQ